MADLIFNVSAPNAKAVFEQLKTDLGSLKSAVDATKGVFESLAATLSKVSPEIARAAADIGRSASVGLKSTTPEVTRAGEELGKGAGKGVADGLKSSEADITRAAQNAKKTLQSELDKGGITVKVRATASPIDFGGGVKISASTRNVDAESIAMLRGATDVLKETLQAREAAYAKHVVSLNTQINQIKAAREKESNDLRDAMLRDRELNARFESVSPKTQLSRANVVSKIAIDDAGIEMAVRRYGSLVTAIATSDVEMSKLRATAAATATNVETLATAQTKFANSFGAAVGGINTSVEAQERLRGAIQRTTTVMAEQGGAFGALGVRSKEVAGTLDMAIAKYKQLESESSRAAMLQANLAKNPVRSTYETGSYSSIQGSKIGQLVTGADEVESLGAAIRALDTGHKALASSQTKSAASSSQVKTAFEALGDQSRNLHSAVRGLTSAFGAMWLTWGNIIPLMAGAAISNSIVEMVKAGAELEYQMTFVSQLTDGSAISVEKFSRAMEGSMVSSKEGAQGMRAMAQAGLDTTQALAALPAVMNLAVVGETSMAQAALTATGIMHAFNLQVYDMGRITDVLTKSAAISNTSVASMSESMKTASVIADMYKMRLEEVSAGLVILGNRNIIGSAAGTAMKNMVSDLAAPTEKAAAIMKKLGVEAYDATTGGLKPLKALVAELSVAFTGLSEKTKNQALEGMFDERARKAVAALIEEYESFGKVLDKLDNGSKDFADNVRQALAGTVSGQMKATANELSMVFDKAFEHTANSWSNLAAELNQGVKSDAFRGFVEVVNLGTIGLLKNIEVVVGLGAALAALPAVVTVLSSAYQLYTAEAALATAATVAEQAALMSAGGATVTATAATEALAVAQKGAATATTLLTAAISRIAWPIAIVAGLATAYHFLTRGIDSAKEADERRHRVSLDTIDALEKETARLNEESRALEIAAQKGLSYAEAMRKAKEETMDNAIAMSRADLNKKSMQYGDALAATTNTEGMSANDLEKASQKAVRLSLEVKAAQENLASLISDTEKGKAALARNTDAATLNTQRKAIDGLIEGHSKLNKEISNRSNKGEKGLEGIAKDLASVHKDLKEVKPDDVKKIEELKNKLEGLKSTANNTAKTINFSEPSKKSHAAFGNELSSIKTWLSEQERLVEASYSNQAQLLDKKHKGDLISDAEYFDSMIKEENAFLLKQKELREQAAVRAKDEFASRKTKIDVMPAGVEKNTALKDLENSRKELSDHLQAQNDKDVESVRKREQDISIAFAIENKKVTKSVDDYIRKMQEKTQADQDMQNARRAMQGQPEEVVAAFEAETAARSKGASEVEKLSEMYNEASAELTKFSEQIVESGIAGEEIDEKRIKRLDQLKEKYDILATAVAKVSVANEKNAKEASDNAHLKSVQDQTDKLAKEINTKLADAIVSAGKNSGSELRKYIEEALITKPFRVTLETILAPMSKDIANAYMEVMGVGSKKVGIDGKPVANSLVSGGFDKSFGDGVKRFGDWLQKGDLGDTMKGFGKSISDSSAKIGEYAQNLGYVAGAFQSAQDFEKGNYGAAAGGALGTWVGGGNPMATMIGKGIGEALFGGFSTTYKGTFLYGGYGYDTESGFKWGGRKAYEQSGGAFGGSTTTNSSWYDLEPQIEAYLTAAGETVMSNVKEWAKMVGLSADAIKGYNKQIEVPRDGLDANGLLDAINKAMNGMGDDVAQYAWGDILLPLNNGAETAGQILQRLGTDLTTVNNTLRDLGKPLYDSTMEGVQAVEALIKSVGGLEKFTDLAATLQLVNAAMEALGQPLFDISVQGAQAAKSLTDSVGGLDKFKTLADNLLGVNEALDAMGFGKLAASLDGSKIAEELVKIAGGLDKFQSITSAYYDKAYTPQEKYKNSLKTLGDAFSELGKDAPKTVAELRNLVEKQDLNTEAGRKMALSLMELAPALNDAAEAARKLQEDADKFFKSLVDVQGDQSVGSLQTAFNSAMANVTAAMPDITNWGDLTSITRDQYVGYSDTDRATLDTAVSAYGALRDAIKAAAEEAKSAAKTAQDAADAATKAYEDALKSVSDNVRDAKRGLADFGKTDLQKRLAQIGYDAEDTQTELNKLESEASKLSAKATELNLKAAALSLDTTDTITNDLVNAAINLKDDSTTVAKNVSEALTNSVEAFGDALELTPAISGLFDDVLKGLKDLPVALNAVTSAVAGVGSAAGQAAGIVGSFSAATASAGTAAASSASSVSTLSAAISTVTASVAAATAALGTLASAFGAATTSLDGLSASFGAATASGSAMAGTLSTVSGAFGEISGAAAAAAGAISAAASSMASAASASAISSFNVPPTTDFVGPPAPIAKAGGGAIYGPGTATSDSIPAMLSNGEYVIKASSASKYGTRFLDALNAGVLKPTIYRTTGGTVGDLKELRTDEAYLGTFTKLVETFGGTTKTFSQVLSTLSSNGYKPPQGSADSAKGFFLNLVQQAKPTYDDKGIAHFDDAARAAINALDAIGTSIDQFIDTLETRQGWTEKLGVLNNSTTERALSLQKDLSSTTDDLTKSLIKQVYAQEDLIEVSKKETAYNVNRLTATGDLVGAAAAQRTSDLSGYVSNIANAESKLRLGGLSEDEEYTQNYIITTGKLAIEQYDLNKAREGEIAALGRLASAQSALENTNVALLRAKGDNKGADAAQRAIDLKPVLDSTTLATAKLATATDENEIATLKGTIATNQQTESLYDLNKARQAEIEVLNRQKSVADTLESTYIEMLKATGRGAEAAALELAKLTDGMDAAHIAMARQTTAYQMLISAQSGLRTTGDMLLNSQANQLEFKGDTAGAAAIRRDIDIRPYTESIATATEKLATATDKTEIATLNATIATGKQSIANYDAAKAIDAEVEAAKAAQQAANALAETYKDLKGQIEQANIELAKASGNDVLAEELQTALDLRGHEGDAYYETLYRELQAVRKLTAAMQQLNSITDETEKIEISLLRARGQNTLADAVERSAYLKDALMPAARAQVELQNSNASFKEFVSSKGYATNARDLLLALGFDGAALDAEEVNRIRQEELAASYTPGAVTPGDLSAGYPGRIPSKINEVKAWLETNLAKDMLAQGVPLGDQSLGEKFNKLAREFSAIQRTESQRTALQSVVDAKNDIVTAYDLQQAKKAELEIIKLQDEAYKQQLDAQQAVTQAQQKYADVLRSTIDNLQDFLKTLDGAATPTQNLRQARLDFKTVALRAADGDTSAYKDLTPAAKTFLDLSKNYSKTIQDYRRDEAAVRATLNAVIQVNQAELSKLPEEIARAADPTKEAWEDLQKALIKEKNASIMTEALSVKVADSKRRLRTAEETLAERYQYQVNKLKDESKTSLTETFNTYVKTLIDENDLPDYSAFDLGDTWAAQIKRVLPDSFFGQSFNAKEMMQAAIDKVMADIKTATTTTAPSLGSVTTSTGSQIPSDTTAPAWQNQPTPSGTGTSTTTTATTPPPEVRWWESILQSNGLPLSGALYDYAKASLTKAPGYVLPVVAYARYNNLTIQDAWDVLQLHNSYTKPVESLRSLITDMGYPAFAVGTNEVPRDMLAQIHKGEVIIPEAFNPERYSKATGNTALVEEIKALRAQVAALQKSTEAGQNAIAANTRKTAQALTKFDTDGMPETRS